MTASERQLFKLAGWRQLEVDLFPPASCFVISQTPYYHLNCLKLTKSFPYRNKNLQGYSFSLVYYASMKKLVFITFYDIFTSEGNYIIEKWTIGAVVDLREIQELLSISSTWLVSGVFISNICTDLSYKF